MKFTRLRITGFKSFVEPVDVPIEPGLTGVIGPNGCGKSNLVEALRFVMGESSHKALRGGGMEDVIFAGTNARPARSWAEVRLSVTTPAGRALPTGVPGGEQIEVARRIERDLGSVYRVNGREARARDVQLLFADAATGARSAALVRQGQVSELIAAKPVQRRGILEDAAGIGGLHARRHEAELKLGQAEQNLARLDDVTAEISAQLESLRRQARQASRYRNLSGEIRKAEAALSLVRWHAAVERLAEAERAHGSALAALADAMAAQGQAARDEAVAGDCLPRLRNEAAAASAALDRLRIAAAEIEREAERMSARRRELSDRVVQTRTDLRREQEIAQEAKGQIATLEAEDERLRRDCDGEASAVEAARRRAEALFADAVRAQQTLTGASEALAAATAERSAAERVVRDCDARLERVRADLARATAERDAAARPDVEAGCGDAASALEAALSRLRDAEAALQSAEADFAGAGEAERVAGPPRDQAERALSALQAEAKTLARVLEIDGGRRHSPVIDAIRAAPGYEQALVAALGEDLDAPLDPEAPGHWGGADAVDGEPGLPAGCESLAARVEAPAALARRLAQVGIVPEGEALPAASTLARGQRVVTRDGALMRWDGFTVRAGAPTAAAKRLEQKNRLVALVDEVKAAQDRASGAAAALAAARAARQDFEGRLAQARAAARDARRAADSARSSAAEAERRFAREAERRSALAATVERLEAEQMRLAGDGRAAAEALVALPHAGDLAARRDAAARDAAAAQQAAREAQTAAEQAASRAAGRRRRQEAVATDRARWAERAERAAVRMAELDARLAAAERDLQQADELPDTLDARRRAVVREIAAAEEGAAGSAATLAAAEASHRDAARRARAAVETLSSAREAKAREEERVASARQARDDLARRIGEVFARRPDQLAELADVKAGAPLPEPIAIETRLERLKAERERLGGVNLRAEEEAADLEERRATMERERADVEAAIRRLRTAIQGLNREGRERLLEAFKAVNAHFQSLFTRLFGGGSAELMLVGSEDPLDAGLEIMARPPGKKPQLMTLLSGGEQALTAMALIFAVFLTNPSPICVLDEIDAPLDDANVERFCALLEDMRGQTETRFLVVTHNPITMARMDRLFGVTMAERGVSQLVSVDLETAERMREAS
ncbi:chromosome segregation protein SMC [Faunimonas sp. B44]|uniref:chromosome segregation protein SMC n=1 Tax=Faunimonas sp. B44 TaxID=3461493 RepID=UPI0040444B67